MASELRVNTLKDSSGNNSVGMAYVAGGSAKSWAYIDGSDGTPVVVDSLNVSSVVDNNVGKYGPVMTNPMSDVNYRKMGISNQSTVDSVALGQTFTGSNLSITNTTTTYGVLCYASGYKDSKHVYTDVLGDLA